MAYLGLLAVRVVAQLFGCFVLLDEGPYRLEGGGVRCEFMLPLTVEGGRRNEMQDWTTNALKYPGGNHYYFCHFVGFGQRRCRECRFVDERRRKAGDQAAILGRHLALTRTLTVSGKAPHVILLESREIIM
jgi:hypothetical protein